MKALAYVYCLRGGDRVSDTQVDNYSTASQYWDSIGMEAAILTSIENAVEDDGAIQLGKVMRLYSISQKAKYDVSQSKSILRELAAIKASSYDEMLAKLFDLPSQSMMSLGKLVSVYALPLSHAFADESSLQFSLAEQFGYAFVVSGGEFKGAEVYFVNRDAISLGDAVEVFQRLKLLS